MTSPHLAVLPPLEKTVLGERLEADVVRDVEVGGTMVASALEGYSHGLVLLGPRTPLNSLLLDTAEALLKEKLKLWFSAVEIDDDQMLDLLSTGRETPSFQLHPQLGVQLVAVEVPLEAKGDLEELMSFALKRQALTRSCLHGGRSAQFYVLRAEAEDLHASLGFFDLRGQELTALESLLDLGAPDTLFRASPLLMGLKEPMVGHWRCTLLAASEPEEQLAKTLRLMRSWARLRSFPRRAEPRPQQLRLLQEELRQLSEPKALAERSTLILHFSRAVDRRKLQRERAKALEWCGLSDERQDLTPYLLNMSLDVCLAGALLYPLQRNERTTLGSDPDNAVVLDGLGVLPNLCTIVNADDYKLTLSRPDFARRHVLVNGKTLAKETMVLSHHDRICLGRAQMFLVHIPRHGVETIQEEELSQPSLQNLQCILPEDLSFFLPPLPRQGFDVSFENLQHLLDHSDALRNLQYYIKDLLPRLPPAQGLACFETLRKACYLVDEANMITREVRPEEHLQFELELVWDIFRKPEEVLVIRLMRYSRSREESERPTGQVLHYWSYERFLDRLQQIRHVHRVHCQMRAWAGAHQMLQDPWMEHNTFPVRQVLSQALEDCHGEELRSRFANLQQELHEKTESLEQQAEIIAQLREQLLPLVSLAMEPEGPEGPEGPEEVSLEQNDEENFTMSVSASTFSDGPGSREGTEARSRGFKVDKLSNSLQGLAPVLLSQASLTPPHCYRDLNR